MAVFNAALRHCKAALQGWTLEKYTQQHCEVVLLISELYKNLAACETDPHNQCVLQKQRAKRVEGVLEAVVPTASAKSLSLYRTLQLEIADAYRLIADAKHNDGRPYPKVAGPASEAKTHLEAFLETFKVNGQLPKKVDDDAEAAAFLDAVFHLAWLLYRLQPPAQYRKGPDARWLVQAVLGYQYVMDYVERNGKPRASSTAVSSLEICHEMCGLLRERAQAIEQGVLND